jgi:hypothetical protein
MAGYPADGTMGDLLIAMEESLKQTTQINYLGDVRIKIGPWYWQPFDNYTVYLEPIGSPEEVLGEHGVQWIKRSTHIVNVECHVPWMHADHAESIVGRGSANMGLTDMVADICSYLENNVLGLAGLEVKLPPTIEAPEGAYFDIEVEEQTYIRVATLRYEAKTIPFVRPIDT